LFGRGEAVQADVVPKQAEYGDENRGYALHIGILGGVSLGGAFDWNRFQMTGGLYHPFLTGVNRIPRRHASPRHRGFNDL
jgi:hypothetical protein